MKLVVANDVVGPEWNAMVAGLGGYIWHCPQWAQYTISDQANAEPLYFTLRDESDDVVGLALGFYAESPRRFVGSLTSQFWLDAMPSVRNRDPVLLDSFIGLLENYARERSAVRMTLGSFASPDGDDILHGRGYHVERRLEFVIPLHKSEEELWRDFAHKRRKNIKKAVRLGVTIQDLAPEEGVSHLRRLQQESSGRIVARGGPAIGDVRDSTRDPVYTLVESGLGLLVGASVDGDIVSASLFTCFNGLAYHTLSGHGARALDTQAPTLLLWEMMKRFQKDGVAHLNLGGCSAAALHEESPEHGVYSYKKAFGAETLECASGQLVLRRGVSQMMSAMRTLTGRQV